MLRKKQEICFTLLLFLSLAGVVQAQGTVADYQRSDALKQTMRDKIYNMPISFTWLDSDKQFWYMQRTPQGKEFVLVDVQKNAKQPAFNHAKLAEQLSAAANKKYEAYKLPFNTITYVQNGKELEFVADEYVWRCNLDTYQCQNKGKFRPQERRYWGAGDNDLRARTVASPDSNWEAYIKNYNVYLKSRKTKEEYALSFDGSEGEYYSSDIQWAPDSKELVTNKVRPNQKHLIYLIESSPLDQLQPKLSTRDYLKPGDALPTRKPQLFLVDSRKQIALEPSLFNQQYSLSNLKWRQDSRTFTFEYNERGHQVYRVLEADGQTGAVKPLIEEKSKTFIDYSGKKFRFDTQDGKEIIWASERDGWNHLYLIDGKTGKVKNQITKGEWVVRNVVKVDEKKQSIIFAASGREKGQDPYLLHYYKVNFNGKGLTPLTTENANHVVTFSKDFGYFVDNYSRVDMAPVTVLRSADSGKVIMELEKTNIAALDASKLKMPEVFTSKGRDGKTDIWGIIVKPTNFDANKKYPVIEYIYAGPQSSFVPKSYGGGVRGLQELAELGFIVVQIDGMGTSNRSKAFHDVCWKNIKDAGFPDRILWMQAAAQKNPAMDISKVGIYGTSAGGQNSAGAVIFHPEFYKVAVSSAGCHDNRMDKMWWNEQWMGYPIGPQYAESSNVTNAHKMGGKLMLIVGEMDDNVDPASTLQLVNALIKSDKDFDFLMVPGMGHSSGGDFGERKRRDYFVRHLLGVQPPAWNEWDSALRVSNTSTSNAMTN